MNGLLLDTHVWWWQLTGSARLPAGLARAIKDSPDNCWLSPVSVWELGILVGKNRLRIPLDFRPWVERALEVFPLREAAMVNEVAVRSLELEVPDRDPADRFLAATALIYDLTLLTVDERLSSQEWLPTLSE